MPDLPITGLTALTTVPDDNFPLAIVDTTDLSQSPQGTTKKVERGTLLGGILPLRVPVKNNSGITTLTKGTLLMAVGALGDRVLADPAVTNGSVAGIYIIGVAEENIGPGADGYAVSYAELRNMNTLAYPVGTILWNDPAVAGGFSITPPVAPNLKIPFAIVTRQNAASGRWFVRETVSPDLQDLSDVNAPTPSDGQVLTWVNANSRWEAVTKVSGTTGKLAKFTSAGVVGDSILTESGTDVSAAGTLTAQGFRISTAAFNAQTGTTYTLQTTDNGKVVTLANANPIALTVPAGLGASFSCSLIQLGAGQVTVSGSGATVNSRGGATKMAGQYAQASLVAYGADTLVLAGDLTV